jgi:hypothetical protein
VNLDPPASLLAHHLAEDFSYADSGLFTATVPFPPSPSDDEAHRAGDWGCPEPNIGGSPRPAP